jgi:SAM-dependent methyltransferase
VRFNSPERLADFKAGRYPKIHDAIASMIISEMRGTRVLDIGCNYGLLSDRLLKKLGADFVLGIDADPEAVRKGLEAGVGATLTVLKVKAETFPEIARLIRDNRITVVVARRFLSEPFGYNAKDLATGPDFGRQLHEAGIKEMFVQGRAPREDAVNLMPTTREEVAILLGHFREVKRAGDVSYLRAR